MEKNKKKSSLKERDKQIICFLGVIVLLIGAWFGQQELNKTVKKQDKAIMEKKEKADKLDAVKKNIDDLKKETAEMEEVNKKILKQYPQKTSIEKVIEHILYMWKKEKISVGVPQISYSDNGDFYKFTDGEGKESATGPTIKETNITIEYNTSYKELKRAIEYINTNCVVKDGETPVKAMIKSVTISAEEAGALRGDMIIGVYTGIDMSEYKEPVFEGIDIGKKSLFK